MNIIKLTDEHIEGVRPLFYDPTAFAINPMFLSQQHYNREQQHKTYTVFCDTYLSRLDSFCAFGAMNEAGVIEALISFFISEEEPSWYLTDGRSSVQPSHTPNSRGNNQLFLNLFDKIIEFNEQGGRYKFYTVNHIDARNKLEFGLSDKVVERYSHFDEYKVNASERPFYQSHWEILFKRALLPFDAFVRCTFLQQKYRPQLPIGGNI